MTFFTEITLKFSLCSNSKIAAYTYYIRYKCQMISLLINHFKKWFWWKMSWIKVVPRGHFEYWNFNFWYPYLLTKIHFPNYLGRPTTKYLLRCWFLPRPPQERGPIVLKLGDIINVDPLTANLTSILTSAASNSLKTASKVQNLHILSWPSDRDYDRDMSVKSWPNLC